MIIIAIPKETSLQLHKWVLRRLTPEERKALEQTAPLSLKPCSLGIDLDAALIKIMGVVGELRGRTD